MLATAITINNRAVLEMDGLYSLNDLHRASGGEHRHRPSRWLENEQTRELIAEIEQTPDMAHGKAGIPALVKKRGGRNGSQTWGCREAVIAYAAWINATFHLKVIRAFLDSQTKQPAPQTELSFNIPQPGNGIVEGRREFMEFVEKTIPRETYAELFNSKRIHKIADGYLAYALESRRWIVSFDHRGNQVTTPIQEGECLLRYEDLPDLIRASDCLISTDLLAQIGKAVTDRMHDNAVHMANANKHLREHLNKTKVMNNPVACLR